MPMTEAKIPVTSAIAVPRHVAIIMDGNGRWAAARGLPRVEGHRRGVEAVRRTVRAATDIGIQYLTIFSFSAENWTRPASEIGELMGLLRRVIRNDLADPHKANVRVRVIGEREGLAPDIARLLIEAEELTRENDGLTMVVAFNYGARCARFGRSRSYHPHQRRAAVVQFPALAIGLRRTRVRPDLLARFRPRCVGRRDPRISAARAPVWRTWRADRALGGREHAARPCGEGRRSLREPQPRPARAVRDHSGAARDRRRLCR